MNTKITYLFLFLPFLPFAQGPWEFNTASNTEGFTCNSSAGADTQLAGMKVKVVNLLVQVIEELPLQNSTTELSTKNWGAKGMYFVQITNQNNTTSITKKVMVERK